MTDDMKLYQIEHTDRFEVHHWFAPSENQVVRMFFDWCEVVHGAAPRYFSTKRIRAGDVLPHQQLHLEAALATKCRGAGSYHPENGWVIEPI